MAEQQKNIDVTALFQMSYGLYIVGTAFEGRPNGQIANAVMQITGNPICITACLHKENLTTELVEKSGIFSIGVLDQDVPMPFIGTFGFKCGRDTDKYCDVNFKQGITGAPLVLDWTLSVIEAKVVEAIDVCTHRLFVGEVVGAENVRKGTPLTYAYYHGVKKAKSHKNSPTAIFNAVP
ncbi:MAG TPA: flavin reductase family protein [Synergistaceae bacterium]|nr:flavin reductase family protein [Synergistaceae bacterium]HPJ25773.1 flavin reductase family protein [Synergistaceae bacterium]HPQ37462.1 flavin reductase family protein [Synergistaceae bacterium]